jgi:hypothetical protein
MKIITNGITQASYLNNTNIVKYIDATKYFFFTKEIVNNNVKIQNKGSGCAEVPISISIGNKAQMILIIKASEYGCSLSSLCEIKLKRIIGINAVINRFINRRT